VLFLRFIPGLEANDPLVADSLPSPEFDDSLETMHAAFLSSDPASSSRLFGFTLWESEPLDSVFLGWLAFSETRICVVFNHTE